MKYDNLKYKYFDNFQFFNIFKLFGKLSPCTNITRCIINHKICNKNKFQYICSQAYTYVRSLKITHFITVGALTKSITSHFCNMINTIIVQC